MVALLHGFIAALLFFDNVYKKAGLPLKKQDFSMNPPEKSVFKTKKRIQRFFPIKNRLSLTKMSFLTFYNELQHLFCLFIVFIIN